MAACKTNHHLSAKNKQTKKRLPIYRTTTAETFRALSLFYLCESSQSRYLPKTTTAATALACVGSGGRRKRKCPLGAHKHTHDTHRDILRHTHLLDEAAEKGLDDPVHGAEEDAALAVDVAAVLVGERRREGEGRAESDRPTEGDIGRLPRHVLHKK